MCRLILGSNMLFVLVKFAKFRLHPCKIFRPNKIIMCHFGQEQGSDIRTHAYNFFTLVCITNVEKVTFISVICITNVKNHYRSFGYNWPLLRVKKWHIIILWGWKWTKFLQGWNSNFPNFTRTKHILVLILFVAESCIARLYH